VQTDWFSNILNGGIMVNIAPIVNPGEWVDVGLVEGIVQERYPPESNHAFWFIYLDKGKPTRHPVYWNGEAWEFSPMEGHYGSQVRDSDFYVRELKQGRKPYV
jgi:hypothetical protein